MKKTRGIYIAFEGIGGSGKTYHARQLVKKLKEENLPVEYVKDPHIKMIKKFVQKYDTEKKFPGLKAYILLAGRIILQEEVILPALQDGKIVISDRSPYTSAVYESIRGNISPDFIFRIHNGLVKFPDKVFLLDVPPNVAIKRKKKTKGTLRSYETRAFNTKARDLYLKLSKKDKDRFVVIDNNRKRKVVTEEIWQKVKEIINIQSKV
jgi:dTMP kinase